MSAKRLLPVLLVITLLVLTAPAAPTLSNESEFTLSHLIPNDVFLFIAEQSNPERAFIDQYWGEVFQALVDSGVSDDVIGLISSLLGMGGEGIASEFERIRELAFELIEGVDWDELGCKESVFAEQFNAPVFPPENGSVILMADMVLLLRGTEEGAQKNYKGLGAIIQALANEVNGAAGMDVLHVNKTSRKEIQLTRLEVPAVKSVSLTLGLRDDVIIIALRDQLFEDVLALMNGDSSKKALVDDERFQSAFAKLPTPEDSMTFFSMKALMNRMISMFNSIIAHESGPSDVNLNATMDTALNVINTQALAVYQQGKYKEALALVEKAYEQAPDNSIILYNLACFNTLAGNPGEGLKWLQKAVEGGFYAPKKILGDSDLKSLHDEPAFKKAVAQAAKLAYKYHARDVVENFTDEGEVYSLRMQVNRTYETKDYEQGLELIKQAYAIAPDDTKVLYTMGCLHAILGHEAEAYEFLERAVKGGFYCPNHMSRDSDLDSIRDQQRFKDLVAKAREKAGERTVVQKKEEQVFIKWLIDRIANAVGILDYAATVEATDGHSTVSESIAVLVPGAQKKPIYPVFCAGQQLTGFDRYLPKETLSFSIAGGMNLGALYTFIEDTVRAAGKEGENALDKWAGIQKQIGIDIRKDVIDWIGGNSISVTLDDGGSVWMIKVNDEQKARDTIGTAIEFGTSKLSELIAQKPQMAALAMLGLRTSPTQHDDLKDFNNIYFSMSPQPAVWGVANGYLIFGSSADAIALCLATAKGNHPSIRENPRAMREAIIPDGPFASISLTDRRGMGEEIAQGIGIATMVTGMMGSFIPEPAVRPIIAKVSAILGKLSPVVRKIDFYKSEASCITFDGKAWYTRSVTHYFSPEERAGKKM